MELLACTTQPPHVADTSRCHSSPRPHSRDPPSVASYVQQSVSVLGSPTRQRMCTQTWTFRSVRGLLLSLSAATKERGRVAMWTQSQQTWNTRGYVLVPNRVYIVREDGDNSGFAVRCPGCALMLKGVARQACTESCRERIETELSVEKTEAAEKRTKGELERKASRGALHPHALSELSGRSP